MTIIGGVVYKKAMIFEVFENISAVARSYKVFVINKFDYVCSSNPGNKACVPVLAVFDDFGNFSSCLF